MKAIDNTPTDKWRIQKQVQRLKNFRLSGADKLLLESAEQLECWMNAGTKKDKWNAFAETAHSLDESHKYLANIAI